jgi:hypothetical protein
MKLTKSIKIHITYHSILFVLLQYMFQSMDHDEIQGSILNKKKEKNEKSLKA